MTWLFEEPWTIVLGGVVAEIALGLFLLKTGRGSILAAMVGVLVLAAGLLLVERMVVTEREKIQQVLDGVAAATMKNDAEAVQHFIAPADASPAAAALHSYSASILRRFTIRDANIGGDLDIQIDSAANPPLATARFTARVNFKDSKAQVPYDNYVGKLKVDLRKQGDRWEILDFSDADRGRPGAIGK